MEHLKAVLTRHNITSSAIDKLEAFAPRDGFVVLAEEEFEELREYLGSFPVYRCLVPFMTDDNSNYWCLYVDGPLKNMVCYLSHEELDLAPRFRSLSSFLDTLHQHPHSNGIEDFEDHFFDFPSRQISPKYLLDREIIGALSTAFTAETDEDQLRTQTAFAIMALTSPTDIETLLYPFLDDEDPYVQERAIELLGFHRYQPAAAKLTALTVSAKPNGRTAAKVALKKITASRL
ncbi:hypothetical protein [Hymenobacter negativus]|uniref:HEAT repeat domain-containing protein n=1 Tax=Hymenobacter negativus TaxID=2795026 RepID=A0ABS3QK32_9BACT|nr:hypothetical protein [Hymenobacter negativus]MBO2011606.1 hypothetical protein [Hymenobacter negativus]